MRELIEQISRWREPFALATVLSTSGNTPRGVGSALAVNTAGVVHGAVSGGCVDADVYEECRAVLDGAPPSRLSFGPSADDPLGIGLGCGGNITVFVHQVDPLQDPSFGATVAALRSGKPLARATVVAGPAAVLGQTVAVTVGLTAGRIGVLPLHRRAAERARAAVESGGSRLLVFEDPGEAPVEIFVESYPAPPRLLVFGATDVAGGLSRLAPALGYRVTVCDARALFADPRRFPSGTEVVVDRPERYLTRTEVGPDTVICAMTHDLKFDVPLLTLALRLSVAYVGALGSRGSVAARTEALRLAGLDNEELTRLHAPVGLDLGGRSPEETALAILAEVVMTRHHGCGNPLRDLSGPLHRSVSV